MTWKQIQITCWTVFFIIGCFLWTPHLFAAEIEKTAPQKPQKSIVIKNDGTANGSNGGPFSAMETPGRTRFDFDSLTKLMEEHKTPLAAMTPDWLNVAVEHRTRYDVFDHGFTRTIPGFNDQIHQRTRFLFEIEKIIEEVER